MYAWYERAALCYVYLSDVKISAEDLALRGAKDNNVWDGDEIPPSLSDQIRKSSWFERVSVFLNVSPRFWITLRHLASSETLF